MEAKFRKELMKLEKMNPIKKMNLRETSLGGNKSFVL